jgi:hypothetical protein
MDGASRLGSRQGIMGQEVSVLYREITTLRVLAALQPSSGNLIAMAEMGARELQWASSENTFAYKRHTAGGYMT